MKKQISITESQILINVAGNIYREDAFFLKKELFRYLNEKKYNICIIDMSSISYIDAAGLGTLVVVNNRFHHLGIKIVILGLKGIFKELFQLTQMEKIFEIM
jgi:anti-sigma B factor antagonist